MRGLPVMSRTRTVEVKSRRASWARFGATALMVVGVFVGMSGLERAGAQQTQPGYRLLGGDGGVFSFGSARFVGSAASDPRNCPTNPPERSLPNGSCVALAATPDGDG